MHLQECDSLCACMHFLVMSIMFSSHLINYNYNCPFRKIVILKSVLGIAPAATTPSCERELGSPTHKIAIWCLRKPQFYCMKGQIHNGVATCTLLASSFSFNMHYPPGLYHFYIILEVLPLGQVMQLLCLMYWHNWTTNLSNDNTNGIFCCVYLTL